MRKIKLKYGCKLGNDFFPSGTIVDWVSPDDHRVKSLWPKMKISESSDQVAIIFPGRKQVTIHDKGSLEL